MSKLLSPRVSSKVQSVRSAKTPRASKLAKIPQNPQPAQPAAILASEAKWWEHPRLEVTINHHSYPEWSGFTVDVVGTIAVVTPDHENKFPSNKIGTKEENEARGKLFDRGEILADLIAENPSVLDTIKDAMVQDLRRDSLRGGAKGGSGCVSFVTCEPRAAKVKAQGQGDREWREVSFPSMDGGNMVKEFPHPIPAPTLARLGMIFQDYDTSYVIVAMTPEHCIGVGPNGKQTCMTWGDVQLDNVRPDPEQLATNRPSARRRRQPAE